MRDQEKPVMNDPQKKKRSVIGRRMAKISMKLKV